MGRKGGMRGASSAVKETKGRKKRSRKAFQVTPRVHMFKMLTYVELNVESIGRRGKKNLPRIFFPVFFRFFIDILKCTDHKCLLPMYYFHMQRGK